MKKISYDRWLYAVDLINRAREEFSLTEISKAAGAENPGWTEAALLHRSVVEERLIRGLEKLVMPKQHGRGGATGQRLSPAQRHKYQKLITKFLDQDLGHGWSVSQLAHALGVSTSAIYTARKTGRGTTEKLEFLMKLSETFERGNQMRKKAKLDKASRQKPEQLPNGISSVQKLAIEASERAAELGAILTRLQEALPAFAREGKINNHLRWTEIIYKDLTK